MARRNQVRIVKNAYCRLVPGDIVEMLYDQQGRYAFRVSRAPPRLVHPSRSSDRRGRVRECHSHSYILTPPFPAFSPPRPAS